MSLPSNETEPRHAERIPVTDTDRARFARWTIEGSIPEYRPDLGPCLLFTGSAKTERGYGQFQWGGGGAPNRSAHAFAWESVHGPIPPGLTVDHLCRVTRCVRVGHLELVTQEENFRRAVAARTHCPNDHPYPADAVPGKRRCPICERASRQRCQARRVRLANGLPDRRRKYDPEVLRAALQAVTEGRSIRSVAAEVGCSDQYLGKLVKRARQ